MERIFTMPANDKFHWKHMCVNKLKQQKMVGH